MLKPAFNSNFTGTSATEKMLPSPLAGSFEGSLVLAKVVPWNLDTDGEL